MERGNNSGSVVKNRSSSGCLVIKKKVDGGVGEGSSRNRKVYESKKAKKRGRLSVEEPVSSDEELLEYCGGKGEGLESGSGLGGYKDFGDTGFGRNGLMTEGGGRRNELDIYDFDEYDDLSDVDMMETRYFYERKMDGSSSERKREFSPVLERKSGSASGGGMEFESGSGKGDIIYKRRKSFHGNESGDYYPGKRRFVMRNEIPISMGNDRFRGSDEAIRLQGKNGVLKVRVKNKGEVNEQRPPMYRPMERNNVKNIVIQRHSPYTDRKQPKKSITAGRIDKKPVDKRKTWPAKSSEESDEVSEDDDSSAKLQADNVKAHQPVKRGRKQGSLQSSKNSQPLKIREGKVRRGSGTEKQLLREKIKSMLMSAGWTIDYRPRRGRDYSDAVYVNPSGTAFWSIIKAYDAFQKQLEEEGRTLKASDDSSSLAPIPEDTLSKLTRQTRKKMEKELKRKKREENVAKKKRANRMFEEDESDADSAGKDRRGEKLSSYVKRSGRPGKNSSKDTWRDVISLNDNMQERGHARKSSKIGRCTLLVRNSKKGHDLGTDGFVPYTGKRNLLSWLIDSGTAEFSEKVQYMNRRCTRVMLEGWITRDGIHCGCCSKILTVTKFEIHAGSKLRQPFQNIYLNSGPSLLQCLVDTWNKQDESLCNGFNKIEVEGEDPDDDTCAICADGGNLICCDSCPSTFHQNCLDIQMLPPGDWHCPHCSCKFCGLANVNKAEGNNMKEDLLLTCNLCEKKYHSSCGEMDSSIILTSVLPFCGKTCHEVFDKLQKILGIKHELDDGLCWSLIHRTDLGSDNSTWSFPQRAEWNSKLAVALSIMDECFLPITDRRSGINMIHNVFYSCGSNFTRLNYDGFYTAVLERSDEIISAASIRIHGTQFAEMPFIGTRHIYRRQGMCRQLFSAIESALRSLNVEKLIIPAISELMDTWTNVFGFSTLEESDKRKMKMMNMLVFPGTDMLQKKLHGFEKGLAGVDLHSAARNISDLPGLTQASDLDSSPRPTGSPPQFAIKLKRCGESLDDHKPSFKKEDADVTENDLDNSSEKYKVSADCELTQETCKNDTDIMDIGFPRNDDSLPPNVGCVAGGNDKSMSATYHDDISSNKVTPIVPGERSNVTTNPLQLDVQLNSDKELKDHITSTCEILNVSENALDNPPGKHEVSTDCMLTEESCQIENEILGNEAEPVEEYLSLNLGTATDCKHQSISEETRDNITINKATPVDPCEGSQGTPNSTLQYDMKFKESSEEMKDHVTSTCEDFELAVSALNHSAEKHEVSTEYHLTQEACETDQKLMCNGFPKNDESPEDDTLSPNTRCASGDKPQSISETSHHDICFTDATPVLQGEGSQGTTNSFLRLDSKFEDSGEDAKDHITTTIEEIDVSGYTVDYSAGKQELPGECKSTQEATKTDTEIFGCGSRRNEKTHYVDSSHTFGSIAGDEDQSISETSHDHIVIEKSTLAANNIGDPLGINVHGSPKNDTTHDVDSLSPTSGSVAAGEHQSILETSHYHIMIEKPLLAADNNGYSPEINGCVSLQNDKTHVNSLSPTSGSVAGGEHQSISETCHGHIVIEKSFLSADNVEDTPKISVNGAHTESGNVVDSSSEVPSPNGPNDKPHSIDSLSPTSGSVAGGENQSISEISHDHNVIIKSSVAAENIGSCPEIKVHGAHTDPGYPVDGCSEMPSLNVSDPTLAGTSRETKSHAYTSDMEYSPSSELSISGGDGAFRHLHDQGHDISRVVLKSEVKNAVNIITEVSNIRSVGQSATGETHHDIPDVVVLPVCENDDLSSQ